MKRTLEADLDATSLDLINSYTRAVALAQFTFKHFQRLFDEEAMYASGRTYLEFSNPKVIFNWFNCGTDRDEWHIEPNNDDAALASFFESMKGVWNRKHSYTEKRNKYKDLVHYFLQNPNISVTVQKNWDGDSSIKPGTIGPKTEYMFIEEEEEESSVESDDEE
jgi:hypothetical protein